MNKIKYLFGLISLLIIACSSSNEDKPKENQPTSAEILASDSTSSNVQYSGDERLASINLPDGFHISVFAEVDNARSMTLSPSGTLYVGNRKGDKVYAVRDSDNDNIADEKFIIAEGLDMPNGVAFKDGDLYVAENSRIIKFTNIESQLANPPAYELIYDKYPTDDSHGWKYIAFGPDGKLYVPVGAPCNICNNPDKPIYASITRMNADGSNMEIFAEGIRNTVGFTWHPQTGHMYFTDNGRDMLGDNIPPCELNVASAKGQHFGYPFCHGGTIADPQFGELRGCEEFKKPYRNLGPHVAPLGVKFYTANMFPEQYQDQIFIAEHGSWNRSTKIGYRIQMVSNTQDGQPTYETFIDGWLDDEEQEAWGRPVDVLIAPDGAMLISDDKAGLIYRVTYKG